MAHLPTGVGHGWIKIGTFEGIFARLACTSTTPRILCGDFNSPQAEGPGGEIITWGQDEGRDGRGTPPPGPMPGRAGNGASAKDSPPTTCATSTAPCTPARRRSSGTLKAAEERP